MDTDGHGTHTASTAAGRAVPGASMVGVGRGTARGAVPGARLAAYKVCWHERCGSDDIMAAFDDAVADGVDVISASLGSSSAVDYSEDALSVGAFHAMRRGVVTSLSAGNSGPLSGTVSNVAPWAVSVAAVTTDRRFVSEVVLGNGRRVVASGGLNAFRHLGKGKPALLVDPGTCDSDTLSGKKYKGAVLMCNAESEVSSVQFKATGADAVIMQDPAFALLPMDTAFAYEIPAVIVTAQQYQDIQAFYNSTRYISIHSFPLFPSCKRTSKPLIICWCVGFRWLR